MDVRRWKAWVLGAAWLAVLSGCAGTGGVSGADKGSEAYPRGSEAYPRLRIAYVAFPQAGVERPLPITGQLRVPRVASGRVPAVVIVHGTNGLDSRGELHAEALNRAGIATLEIDLWTPRGIGAGTADSRPRDPQATVPDVFGAFRFLADRPDIDPARIGIAGYSWGGVMSMLAAQADLTARFLGDGRRFAAHNPFYPVCYAYGSPRLPFGRTTGAPIRILTGAEDHYDADAGMCAAMIAKLPAEDAARMSVNVYPGAMHGFNMREACSETYVDPAANRGRGGPGRSCPDPAARADAMVDSVRFFREAFGMR